METLEPGYIDDILLQSDSFTECLTNITETVSLPDDLGITPHPEKSGTMPTQVIDWIIEFIQLVAQKRYNALQASYFISFLQLV